MLRFVPILAATLLLSADVSGVIHPLPPAAQPIEFSLSEDSTRANDQSPAAQEKSPAADFDKTPDKRPDKSADKSNDKPLQPETRLTLVRFVDGELARALEPLPAGKKGFHFKAGAPIDEQQLRMAVGSSGAAVNPGDKVAISSLEFKDREIVIDINGGGRGKKRLRDRIHLELGGVPTVTSSQPDTPVNTNAGATLFLDFDKPVPDLTPDELKQYLSALLDFSKQHSAAVQWMDTLPADIQKAIQDKRPAVGMDREMVVAALGRPDRKVREKAPDGSETEDWIYGKPPAKTVFVKFEGDKVTQVQQFPQ
jgi:hypothetical protein